MALGGCALLLPALCALLSAWQACAAMEMKDQMKVSVGKNAAIHCSFFNKEPSSVVVEWFVTGKTGNRERICYSNSSLSTVELGTDFSDRISVTHGIDSAILSIEEVKLTDEGEFICNVHDIAGGNEETKTQLKVFVSPEMPVVERTNVGISVAETTRSKIATCETRNGYPEPNITWYRNVTPLHKSDDVSISPRVILESSGLYTVQSDLNLRVTREDENVLFYCEVSFYDPEGAKMMESEKFNITVFYPTTKVNVWKEPEGLVKEGDSVTIHCRGNGNPQPLLSLLRGDEEITSKDDGVFVLENVNREHSGSYMCHSLDLDTGEEAEGVTKLEVHYLDTAVVEPSEPEVNLGEDIEVSCSAKASLGTNVRWLKDGMNVSEGHQLYLQDATYEMAGEYTCEVTVPSFSELQSSTVFRVAVLGPPMIMDPKHLVLVARVGTSVNLTCEAQGNPLPAITWNITSTWTLQEQVDEYSIRSLVNIRVTSDLIVSCNATSDGGRDVKSFIIKARPMKSTSAVPSNNGTTAMKVQKENGVIIAVIIICILLLAILGSVLYFLYKKGKLACGRSAKKDITKDNGNKDDIIMEMKTDKTEEAVLLQGVNGDKKQPNDQ